MKAYVVTDGLNIRSQPTMKGSRIIDQAAKHDELEVLEEAGEWVRVRHVKRGKIGFVYAKHVVYSFDWTPWAIGAGAALVLAALAWFAG